MPLQTDSVDQEGLARTTDGKLYVTLGSGSTIPSPTFTGQALFAAGSKTAPSVAVGETGTGMYRDSANIGGFAAGTSGSVGWNNLGLLLVSNGVLQWNASVNNLSGSGADTATGRGGVANSIVNGGAAVAAGSVTSRLEINKAVTAFSNAVAKTVFTVTIPNAAHHAVIELEVQGALGAGGAIGAGEAMATNTYKIAIVRTAGVATVATATAATHAVAVAVAGANTVTATAAVTAMTGAVGATQTFDIQVTITRNAGTSDNHTALLYAKLMNSNATGITIA